jgi:hypothetical protein
LHTPFANGAPNLTTDTPALKGLTSKNAVPVSGNDFRNRPDVNENPVGTHGHSRLVSVNILGDRARRFERKLRISTFSAGSVILCRLRSISCVGILAAPLVLDLVLFLDLATLWDEGNPTMVIFLF